MSNVFNNYFTSIAEKIKPNIKFSPKHFADYLSNTNTNAFFLTPNKKNEIYFSIYSLDSHKWSSPNSIPVKILKHLTNYISQQLSNIFNLSSLTVQFPSVLKITKVIPIHKKQSNFYAIYRPISFLSNIEKIVEKLMHKRLSNFLDINTLIYSLQLSFRQKQLIDVALAVVYLWTCKIILHKLEYYGNCGLCNYWFKSYLSDFTENFTTFFQIRKNLKTCRNSNVGDFRILTLVDYIHVTFIS